MSSQHVSNSNPMVKHTPVVQLATSGHFCRDLRYDPSVTFAEYRYYAEKTRAAEGRHEQDSTNLSLLRSFLPERIQHGTLFWPRIGSKRSSASEVAGQHQHRKETSEYQSMESLGELERLNTQRALRNMSMSACFYLVTMDIYNPITIP
jgi:hypothetical protein